MKSKASAMIAVAALALGGQSAQAQSSVAITAVDVPAQTDTRVSVPVTRQAVGSFEIAAGGISGNTIVLDGASFANDQFPLNSQGNPLFYARFTSGALEGRWFNIAGHDATSVDLNTENTGDPADLSAAQDGDTLTIYPHWTIESIFPEGLSDFAFSDSPSPFNPGFQVLLPRDSDGTGTNVPALTSLIHLDGSPPFDGWLTVGGTAAGDFVVAPQGTLTLRNTNPINTGVANDPGTLVDESTGALTFFALGGSTDFRVIEQVPVEGVANDSVLGTGSVEPVTVAESGLGSVIENSSSPFAPGDQVILFPESASGDGFNLPGATTLIKLNGNFVTLGNVPADDLELSPGEAILIRKAAGTPGSSADWDVSN